MPSAKRYNRKLYGAEASENGATEDEHQLADTGGETQEGAHQDQFDFVLLEAGSKKVLKFLR